MRSLEVWQNASSVAVGNEVGAGNLDRGLSYAKRAALVCPAITFTIVLITMLLHNPLFGLFGLGAEAMMYTKYMLIIYLFFGAVRTCCYIQNECFRAGGEAHRWNSYGDQWTDVVFGPGYMGSRNGAQAAIPRSVLICLHG